MNGLIIFSYSTLTSLDQVRGFYDHLFHFRGTEEMLQRGVKKFWDYGMVDQSTFYTNSIRQTLEIELNTITSEQWSVYVGNKHTEPFVEDVTLQAVEDGCKKIFMLSLSPLNSKTGLVSYEQKVERTLKNITPHIDVVSLSDYGVDNDFIQLIASRLEVAFRYVPKQIKRVKIIFTVHSLPGTESSNHDFIQQYHQMAEEVLTKSQLKGIVPFRLAYRSVGPASQKWLGPDLLQVLKNEAEEGTEAVIICELLSVIENLEVKMEIGQEAKDFALENGLLFIQTNYLNDSYEFIKFLLNKIQQKS